MISSLLYGLNHSPMWQRTVDVWGLNVRAASFDRLAFLGLHRVGLMGQAEDRLLRTLIQPGMQIVDIGANIGLYSLLLARLTGESGHVYSFEPEPNLFAALCDNCAANNIANITPFQCAAGSSNGRAPFARSTFNSGNNSLSASGADSVEVEIARIEDVLPVQFIDFIKIDVQGHELAALSGMERVLNASAGVRVMFEFWPSGLRVAQTEPEALLRFFANRGFTIYSTDNSTLSELADAAPLIQKLGAKGYTNLVASRTGVLNQ